MVKLGSHVSRTPSWVLSQTLEGCHVQPLELVFLIRELEHYLRFRPSKNINQPHFQTENFLFVIWLLPTTDKTGEQTVMFNIRSLGWRRHSYRIIEFRRAAGLQ